MSSNMNKPSSPVPHLTTALSGPLNHLETKLLQQFTAIEAWFRAEWQKVPPPITSSVDLRNAGFKLAPVDTNLFPAGFNNLNPDFFPMCVQAIQSVIVEMMPTCTKILLIPENHTRNTFYLESLFILKTILMKAGFEVRLGSLDLSITETVHLTSHSGHSLSIEPLIRKGDEIGLFDFNPCLVILNNDLSSGVPEILQGVQQVIRPLIHLGWHARLKSTHFHFYHEVVLRFAQHLELDPWLIEPNFTAISEVDFMAQEGIEALACAVDSILSEIKAQYLRHNIQHKPFVVVKSDNGTYGMSVMMVHDAEEIRHLNRKQRTKMSSGKGSQKVSRVIIQEGVYTFETMPDGAVAEPVVYMIGPYVVGGFYRVHQGRRVDENLNAPGMHFEPLAFASCCNMPEEKLPLEDSPNRFYVYGVIARLAALAAAYEHKALGDVQ